VNIGEVWASLRIDGSKAKADAAKVGGDIGDAAGKSMGDRIKGQFSKAKLGDSLKQGLGLGLGFAGVQGIASVVSMGMETIGRSMDMASDKAEAASKANVLFGDSYHIIEEASKSATTAVGLSSGEYLTAAGNLGNLITNFGITGDAGAELSRDLVQLAADMGSFNNASTQEVTEAMGSAFVGETEPIRRFGVMLSAAAVSAKAVELGLAESTKSVSQAAKVQATYALIVEQTSKAQGDFARTASGMANSQKISAARMNEAMTKLGETLAPIAMEVMPIIAEVGLGIVEVFGQLVRTAKEFGRVVQGVVDFFDAPGAEVRRWVADMREIPELAQLTDEQLALAARSAQALGDGFAGAKLQAQGLVDEMNEAALVAEGQVQWDINRQSIDVAIASLQRLQDAYDTGKRTQEGYEASVRNHIRVYPQLVTELEKVPPALQGIIVLQADLMRSYGVMVPETTRAGEQMLGATEETTAGIVASYEDMRTNQVSAVRNAMAESVRAIRIGLVDMRDTIKNGKDKVIDQVKDLQWQMKHPFAEENYEDWLLKKHRKMMRLSAKALEDGRPGLAAQAKSAAEEILDEIDRLPENAYAIAQKVIVALANIKAAAIEARMTVGSQYYDPLSGKLIKAYATGGRTSGGMALVGERGPELVSLPAGSYVHSNEDSRAMVAASAPAGDMHLYIHTDDGQTHDLSAQLQRALMGASDSAHIRYSRPAGA
jgi:uncharacterized protein YjiS (DUF1127 family)